MNENEKIEVEKVDENILSESKNDSQENSVIENVIEESSINNNDESSATKKKKPIIVKIEIGILVFLLVLIISIVGILSFCSLNKKSVLSVVPNNFSVYVRTDSAYDTVEPLLDLNAADVFLATPDLRSVRPVFMMLRSSNFRKNKVVKTVASRPINFSLYDGFSENKNFLASLDLGFLSFATRPLIFIYPKIQNKLKPILDKSNVDLKIVKTDVFSYFEFKNGETSIYFTPVKNFVIASDSSDLLMMAIMAENEISYSEQQRKMLLKKTDGLRVIANARTLAESFTKENDILGSLINVLPYDSLSSISLKVSDSDIFIDCKLPIAVSEQNPTSLDSLISKKSTVPSILAKMGDIVQYYTVLNVGTFSELKNALFPIMPVKNIDSLWSKANSASKLLFSADVEELLFSWTGNEFVAFGIENQNDPVFAIKVTDEKKRQQVFAKIVESILIRDDNSLILGGVRLPKLKLPPFLTNLLSVFGISLPEPYFMVLEDFIYFSASPECLSAIFTNTNAGRSLMRSEGWKAVSSELKNESSISLFYNLNRSLPFFLRANNNLRQVFELYNIGRFDAKIKDGELNIMLQANATKNADLRSVPGFPISIGKNASISSFVVENSKNPSAVFWTERNSVHSLDLASLEIKIAENVGKCEIASASEKIKNAALWAVNAEGYIYLCDKKLNLLPNFPIKIEENVVSGIASCEDGVLVPLENGSVILVNQKGETSLIKMPEISIKASPTVLEKEFAVYNKSFFGSIYFADWKKKECLNVENPLEVDGIAFGSPAMIQNGRKTYSALVTQAGLLTIWDGAIQDPVVQKNINGIFEENIVASEKYFYVLSTNAVLYRIALNGETLSVKIPNATAKNSYICVRENKKGVFSVFVNADSNVIYGFDENLELLSGFPLTGSGNPVFADVNGDKNPELLAMTLDKKIIAWNMR